MTSKTVVLITGANRGIGRGLADTYLSRPNHTVIALVRDTTSVTSQSLLRESASHGQDSQAILITYDASDANSADAAISDLRAQHPEVTQIDTIIANAGYMDYSGPSLDASREIYIEHLTTNALAPLFLLKATLPLLSRSPTPKLIAISSAVGSIAFTGSHNANFDTKGNRRGSALPYGAAKCALNYIMVKLDIEHPDVAVGLFTPGPTMTGFGGERVKWDLVPGAMYIEPVVEGLMRQFDGLKKQKVGDLRLKDWSGKEIAW